MTHKYGIETLGFFMVGNPSDTKESVLETMNFAKKIKLDFIQVCRAIAKPDTGLNDVLIERCGVDFWREYILDEGRFNRLPTPWTELSEKDIDDLTKRFYRDFYFRPSCVVRRILKIKSIGELMRYVGVGMKWFFCAEKDDV